MKDFIKVTMNALKKKPKVQNEATITHIAKIVVNLPRRRIEKKIEDLLGE